VLPAVSVVLPTYNRAGTLNRAIESVLNQEFKDFELIIVDDRSTDGTSIILSEYAGHEKIRLISQLLPGCARARNIGVLASSGRYIAFQDSDDEWASNMLEQAVGALEATSPEVGVFYGDMVRIEEDGSRSYWESPEVRKGALINEHTLDYQVCCIGIQSAVIKRECFNRVGLFDESLPRFIDLELFIRLSESYDFIHCKEPLVNYHAGEGISTNVQAQVIARQYLLEKYRPRLEENRHHLVAQNMHLAIAFQQEKIALLSAELAMLSERLREKEGRG